MENELLPEKKVKKQLFWTNGCYRAALVEVYGGMLSMKERRLHINELKLKIKTKLEINEFDPKVHELYMQRVLSMSTEKLSLVVKAFQTGQQYRKQETIDAIMTELFERSANPETSNIHEQPKV